MKKSLEILVFAFLLFGCTPSDNKLQIAPEPPVSKPAEVYWHERENDVQWFNWTGANDVTFIPENNATPVYWHQMCVHKLCDEQLNVVQWFNGMGANDAKFIPESNAVEEIFQECLRVKPLSDDKAAIYKAWLADRISEIQVITPGTPRSRVNQILQQNGGLSTPGAAIYSHADCYMLKVRIEFESTPNSDGHLAFNDNDKVKATSLPYLGLYITD